MNISKRAAYTAAILAGLSGLISLYWAAGGTVGIHTVGGQVEEFAQRGGAMPIIVALCTALIKFAGMVLALALVRPWGKTIPNPLLRLFGWLAGACMTLYGALNVLVGGLVLSGVLHAAHADRYALKWHVFFWDAYFVVWGIALLLAVWNRTSARSSHSMQVSG